MNSSILNSKKKRRSSSKFLISNKQAKLLVSRKCRRVNLLDRNRHINVNDVSTSEESGVDLNTIKLEQQEPIISSEQQIQHMELGSQQHIAEIAENTETKSISKLSELKNKFTHFKNTLVKSITNIKKPQSGNNNNLVVKDEKKIPHTKSTTSINNNNNKIAITLPRQTSRKELPNKENTKPIQNESIKRASTLTRSSSVSTIKTTSTQVKTMKKYESTTSFKSMNLNQQFQHKENQPRPVFNQYAKITYNDKVLYQPASPIQKKVELRRILAQKHMSSSQNKLNILQS